MEICWFLSFPVRNHADLPGRNDPCGSASKPKDAATLDDYAERLDGVERITHLQTRAQILNNTNPEATHSILKANRVVSSLESSETDLSSRKSVTVGSSESHMAPEITHTTIAYGVVDAETDWTVIDKCVV